MRRVRLIPAALLALALLPGSPLPLRAAARSGAQTQAEVRKRLILKDGTYQIVTKYELKGDRVHYYSAEREDWEDLPSDLVDWPATEKWNQEHAPGAASPLTSRTETPPAKAPASAGDAGQSEAAAIDRAAAAERAEQQAKTPEVVPGLRLPDNDGIWVLDNYQGIPELIELHQSAGDVNHGGTHNILKAAIASFHGAQEPVRINGQAAKVRLHVDQPEIYVSLSINNAEQIAPESAFMVNTHGDDDVKEKNSCSSPESRYVIVRVEVNPGERVIGAVRISRVGNVKQSEDIVPTTATILPGGRWMKLTPKEPLTIGEYALMEILAPGVINLDVWDFGVSPNAPENQHPLTPIKGQ